MFLRGKKAVYVIWFIWGRNERVGSRMIPRLRTRVEGVTVEPSILREKSWVERMRDFGPMMRISDLLQFSLRKLCCIQVLTSVRQVVRVQWVAAEMVLWRARSACHRCSSENEGHVGGGFDSGRM